MTKPVQIQPEALQAAGRIKSECLGETGAFAWKAASEIIQQAIGISEQAALSQVREQLEAKAKEWGTAAFTLSHGKLTRFGVALRCRDELLSLAATLGNQEK